LIDCATINQNVRKDLKSKINEINEIYLAKHYDKPVLGYILVGNKSESELYVRLKKLACDDIGIEHRGIILE
jgi:5,10-methylene-tetrahydrofolate dehydrogenase/methenyl tetrahydrofolate cyclohydrolase